MNFFYDIKKLESRLNPVYKELMREVQISARADKRCSGKVEITGILKPFTHLTLDNKYKIFAYSSYELHGPFGQAVAIEREREAPDVYFEYENCIFQKIIPEVCYPVNEVIFCDGTPEGFFEVLLLNDVLCKIFKGYAEVYLDSYIFSLENISDEKEFLFKPSDFAPKFYKNHNGVSKLLLLENSEDGGIELCEYSFSNEISTIFQRGNDSHIKFEKNRFFDDKCCCCYSHKSICICEGEERTYWI